MPPRLAPHLARLIQRIDQLGQELPPDLARRRALQLAGSAAAAAFLLPGLGRAASPIFIDYPFKLGVSSGAPTAHSVVLWTRLAPDPLHGGGFDETRVPIRWELAEDAKFGKNLRSGSWWCTEALAHSAHVEVTGLQPDRVYYYRFIAGDAVSPVGRTRTAPAPGSDPARLRFASTSCQHYEQGWYHAYRQAIADQADFMLFLGDSIYESSWGTDLVRRHLGGEPATLDEYRNRHAQYIHDADLQAARGAMPWIITVDDHEVQNDWADETSAYLDPQFPLRRALAMQAFFEHMPLPMSTLLANANLQLYRRFDFGHLASLHVLDTRQFRDPQPCPKPGISGANTLTDAACPARWGEPRQMLGAAQQAWLGQSLAARPARWSIIGQETLFAPLAQPVDGQVGYYTEPWDGYPQARQAVIDALQASKAPNPVFVGGDVHCTWAMEVPRDAHDLRSTPVASEFTGTSMTSGGFDQATVDTFIGYNPQARYGNSVGHGYMLFDLAPDELRVQVRTAASIKDPESPVSTQAAFRVRAGSPKIERTG
jgi:alkaline phosphatase D